MNKLALFHGYDITLVNRSMSQNLLVPEKHKSYITWQLALYISFSMSSHIIYSSLDILHTLPDFYSIEIV